MFTLTFVDASGCVTISWRGRLTDGAWTLHHVQRFHAKSVFGLRARKISSSTAEPFFSHFPINFCKEKEKKSHLHYVVTPPKLKNSSRLTVPPVLQGCFLVPAPSPLRTPWAASLFVLCGSDWCNSPQVRGTSWYWRTGSPKGDPLLNKKEKKKKARATHALASFFISSLSSFKKTV